MEALKDKLHRIQNLTDEFKSKIENSTLLINEYCRDLKTQIDLLIETKKKELDDMRDKYFENINFYEEKCLRYLEKWDIKHLFNVDVANKFAHEWKEYLKNFTIDENVVCEQTKGADDHLENLNRILRQLQGAQFSGQLLKFRANESKTELIGKFEFEKLEIPPNKIVKVPLKQ